MVIYALSNIFKNYTSQAEDFGLNPNEKGQIAYEQEGATPGLKIKREKEPGRGLLAHCHQESLNMVAWGEKVKGADKKGGNWVKQSSESQVAER